MHQSTNFSNVKTEEKRMISYEYTDPPPHSICLQILNFF